MTDEQVLVGEITAPFGIRGEIKLFPYLDSPDVLKRAGTVTLRLLDGREERFEIASMRSHQGVWLVAFVGLDRNAVEVLRKALVFLPKSALPALPADTYYEWQLLGLSVETETGKSLGQLTKVLYNPVANDVYETPTALIPAHPEFVLVVDLEQKKMIVKDDPGMLKDVGKPRKQSDAH